MVFDAAFADRAIEVWPVSLTVADSEASFATLLSDDETARAARLVYEKDRRPYVAARAALRTLLGAYLGLRPEAIEFAYGERGKPRLAGTGGVRFNLSHKAGLALLAFSADCELGVDIEAVATMNDRDAVAERFFSIEEAADLRALPPTERDLGFYRCWTRKEAYIKCLGDGLYAPLDRFRVTLAPQDAARVVAIDGDTRKASEWTMHDVALPIGYLGALAYREPARPVRVMDVRSVARLRALVG